LPRSAQSRRLVGAEKITDMHRREEPAQGREIEIIRIEIDGSEGYLIAKRVVTQISRRWLRHMQVEKAGCVTVRLCGVLIDFHTYIAAIIHRLKVTGITEERVIVV